ncbi:MAG: beta-galactosidase [Terriglobia bacterium]
MNRRDFISSVAGGVAAAGIGELPASAAGAETQKESQMPQAESRFERSAREKNEIASKITWPTQEPIAFVLRRGHHSEDIMEYYDREYLPANVQLMADAGVLHTRLECYKGLGLDVEMPEIQKTQRMAELMHKHGMKVSLYVGGTMFIESFYQEVPEAVQWEQRDQLNHPVYYIETQTFRHFACFNDPEYHEYIKKVLRIAVEQVRADQIFFDNIFSLPEPKSCRCIRCIPAFKKFLKERYPTRDAAFRRFGHRDPEHIVVNDWDIFNSPDRLVSVDDPILQEWTGFRCETIARHCATYYDYVKSLNPKVSVGFNVKGIYGINRIWRNAVYHPQLAGKIDFSCFDFAGMTARLDSRTGALISEIRSYKMARTLGYSYEELGGRSLALAFNPVKLIPGNGWQGGPHLGWESRSFSAGGQFFREYFERYYTDTESVADVAVLRTWPSMAHSIVSTLVPTILMEQVLIQHKIPFDLIFDEQMDRINRYRAVILAGQESLSQAWITKLTAYARNGGTVLFTGNTAYYNDWREARSTNPVLALMGLPSRQFPQRREPQASRSHRLAPSAISAKAVGNGKMVYIPEIVPGLIGSAGAGRRGFAGDETAFYASNGRRSNFPASEWVLPKNHEEIRQAIVTNLREPLSISTEAPLTTVMELLRRPKTNETIVHFVNFDDNTVPAPFQVQLRNQFSGLKAASVSFFTPEADEPRKVTFTEQNGWITFLAPAAKIYSMIVVSYK